MEKRGAPSEALREGEVGGSARNVLTRRNRATGPVEEPAGDDLRRVGPFPVELLLRYLGDSPRRWHDLEYRFRLLSPDLSGARVLVIGCSDGTSTALLGKRGAYVTGVDRSPDAVAVCRRRAQVNGVAHLTELICAPIEELEFPVASFDLVWVDGVLHRLKQRLPALLGRLCLWAKPNAGIVFFEPVAFSPPLWGPRDPAADDAQPLTARDIEKLREFFPEVEVRPFEWLGRASKALLGDAPYDGSGWLRRRVLDVVRGLDYALLSLPALASLGTQAVMFTQLPSSLETL